MPLPHYQPHRPCQAFAGLFFPTVCFHISLSSFFSILLSPLKSPFLIVLSTFILPQMYVKIFLHAYIHSTDLNLEWFEDGALRRIICSKDCYPPKS